jgi:hypothetical protein
MNTSDTITIEYLLAKNQEANMVSNMITIMFLISNYLIYRLLHKTNKSLINKYNYILELFNKKYNIGNIDDLDLLLLKLKEELESSDNSEEDDDDSEEEEEESEEEDDDTEEDDDDTEEDDDDTEEDEEESEEEDDDTEEEEKLDNTDNSKYTTFLRSRNKKKHEVVYGFDREYKTEDNLGINGKNWSLD